MCVKEGGCISLGKKKVDCPLMLMCDLTSFANGNCNFGEGVDKGGTEHEMWFW